MDPEITDQIFDEMLPVFQRLETQNAAILQFLKDKGIASDDELAPYLEEAGKSTSVRWQVTRIRVAKLLASAEKQAMQDTASVAEKVAKEAADKIAVEPVGTGEKNHRETNSDSADNKGADNKPAETVAAKSNEATGDGRRAADGNSNTQKNEATEPESTNQENIRWNAVSEDRPQRDKPVPKTSRTEVPKDASSEHKSPGVKAAG